MMMLMLMLVLGVGLSSSSSGSPSDIVSKEAVSDKLPSEDEDEESVDKKEGRFGEKSREGMASPNSFADATAPTGSTAVNRVGGEEDGGRGGAERLGRRVVLAVLPCVVDWRVAL